MAPYPLSEMYNYHNRPCKWRTIIIIFLVRIWRCTIKGYGKNLGPPPDFYRKVIGFARILFLRGNHITFFFDEKVRFFNFAKKKTHPNLQAEIQKSAFFSWFSNKSCSKKRYQFLPTYILSILFGRIKKKTHFFGFPPVNWGAFFFFCKIEKTHLFIKKKVIGFPRKNKIRANPITFL